DHNESFQLQWMTVWMRRRDERLRVGESGFSLIPGRKLSPTPSPPARAAGAPRTTAVPSAASGPDTAAAVAQPCLPIVRAALRRFSRATNASTLAARAMPAR